MREEPKANKRERDGFVRDPITWATYGLVGYFAFTETVLGPIMPFLREEQGLGYAAAGLHFSAFALGGLLVGVLGDRLLGLWGRWAGLWGGASGIAFGALLLILSPGAWATTPLRWSLASAAPCCWCWTPSPRPSGWRSSCTTCSPSRSTRSAR